MPTGSAKSRSGSASNEPERSRWATTTATSTSSVSRALSQSGSRQPWHSPPSFCCSFLGSRGSGGAAQSQQRSGRLGSGYRSLSASWRRLSQRTQLGARLRAFDHPARCRLRRAARSLGRSGLGRSVLRLRAPLHDRDRSAATASEGGPAQRCPAGGPAAPDKAVVTIRYSANMPLRYYLDARTRPPGTASAAPDRPGRLRNGGSRERTAPPSF